MERRLWQVVVAGAERWAALEVKPQTGRGRAPFDPRMQALSETSDGATTRFWRVSWRRPTNWRGVPMLLLDATADREVVQATFPHARETLRWHEVDVDLNLRAVLVTGQSFSKSALCPPQDASEGKRRTARDLVTKARRMVGLVAGAHGHGRTVVCSSKAVRPALLDHWVEHPTLDSMHYGATRGIDAAKDHAAALAVGLTQWPVWLLDGVVAAATHDTDPQAPMDLLGTGVDAHGNPVMRRDRERLVRMRDGRDLYLPCPEADSAWGRRIDAQWREAEHVQFLGRLRPVHRTETATYVHACSVFPEGVVWDEVLSVDELLEGQHAHEDVWEHLPVCHGVVDEVLTPPRMWGGDLSAPAAVRSFVSAYASCAGFRPFAWKDRDGVRHQGLVAAWVTDVRGALEAMHAPPECLATLELGEPNAPLRPSRTLEPDAVTLAMVTLNSALFELAAADYPAWKVSHPLVEGEDERMRRLEFLSQWLPPDEDAAEPEASQELADTC